ncbi:hypothetical protein B296_00046231 [Ensete ventricosum]|uniref:Uncharacterized protein n=1 Tax=Ensete ventricosum TaxID=4639 RepID=A0A426YBT3_ENSVE|nr:hypothetical protein B296_00046231 [Ensete ventricosum]
MFIFVQAYLSLVHDSKQIASSTERIGATLSEICNSLISAFRNLRKTDEYDQFFPVNFPSIMHFVEDYPTNCIMPFNRGLEITSFAKEALFAAAMVLKRKP